MQAIIVVYSFDSFVNIVAGIAYYSSGTILWGSLYTLINCCLVLLFTKKFKDKYFVIRLFSFTLLTIFFTSAVTKQILDYTAILSIIFLISGLVATFLPLPRQQ
jgi:hypothetical protein